ncbi:MAG: PCRF domain-containing protein, partial [Bacteroidia bacterium]|nr:PCRF domain-containing protein [Bacteroidia bacterium]
MAELQARFKELTEKQHADDFWADMKAAQTVNQEAKRISNKLDYYKKLEASLEDASALADMAEEYDEIGEVEGIVAEIVRLETEIEELRLASLLKGKYDAANAILTLHAGAGGTEAQDWTSMLYRMY